MRLYLLFNNLLQNNKVVLCQNLLFDFVLLLLILTNNVWLETCYKFNKNI